MYPWIGDTRAGNYLVALQWVGATGCAWDATLCARLVARGV